MSGPLIVHVHIESKQINGLKASLLGKGNRVIAKCGIHDQFNVAK